MKWNYNSDLNLWTPEPDFLEKINDLDYIIKQQPKQFIRLVLKNEPTALNEWEVFETGDYLLVESPCDIKIYLNERKTENEISCSSGDIIKAKFFKFYITALTRTVQPIILYIGKNTEVLKPKPRDLTLFQNIALDNGSFPYSLGYQLGKKVKKIIFHFVLNSNTDIYIDKIRITFQKYFNGVYNLLGDYSADPTSSVYQIYKPWANFSSFQTNGAPPPYATMVNIVCPPDFLGSFDFAIDQIAINFDKNVATLTNGTLKIYYQES